MKTRDSFCKKHNTINKFTKKWIPYCEYCKEEKTAKAIFAFAVFVIIFTLYLYIKLWA